MITFIYDAIGNKIEKRTYKGAVNKTDTTTYIKGFVYRNDTLQFFAQEEGRIRMDSVSSSGVGKGFIYDYFIKDNVGNVRMVLTEEQKQDIYPAASLEDGSLAIDTNYYSINASDITDKSLIPSFTSSNDYQNNNGIPNPDPGITATGISNKLYKLNGATGDKIGLGITLKVMSGDTVNIFGKSYYHLNSGVTPDNSSLITSVLSSFINAFASSPGIGFAHEGTTFATELNSSPVTTGDLTSWLNSVPTPTTTPRAYVNWVLFDEHFVPVASGSGFDGVGSADAVVLHQKSVNIMTNGFLYVYCSNESNIDVFFDNLQVVQSHGPLVEEDHYYPFGLTMAGLSSKSAGSLTNNYKFNGNEEQHKEFTDGSGLELMDFNARMYNAQIGKFMSIDPLASSTPTLSPYCFGADDPLLFSDPTGMTLLKVPEITHGAIDEMGGGMGGGGGGNPFDVGDAHNTAFNIGQDEMAQAQASSAQASANYAEYGTFTPDITTYTGKAAQDEYVALKVGSSFLVGAVSAINDYLSQTSASSSTTVTGAQYASSNSSNPITIDNTAEAMNHYMHGNGESVNIGPNTQFELLTSQEFEYHESRIVSGQTNAMSGDFSVNMTWMLGAFYIGHTNVDYSISCSGQNCIVNFSLFVNDGFWDVDYIDENTLGKTGIKQYQPDGMGPNLERFGGHPYQFIPVNIQVNFVNPGY